MTTIASLVWLYCILSSLTLSPGRPGFPGFPGKPGGPYICIKNIGNKNLSKSKSQLSMLKNGIYLLVHCLDNHVFTIVTLGFEMPSRALLFIIVVIFSLVVHHLHHVRADQQVQEAPTLISNDERESTQCVCVCVCSVMCLPEDPDLREDLLHQAIHRVPTD